MCEPLCAEAKLWTHSYPACCFQGYSPCVRAPRPNLVSGEMHVNKLPDAAEQTGEGRLAFIYTQNAQPEPCTHMAAFGRCADTSGVGTGN